MANKPICGCGKTTLINPNSFLGQDKFISTPVPIEDLTIYVELTTSKKARTTLTKTNDGNSSENSPNVKVNFIDGTDVNNSGKKYLTTKFTDQTTIFDNENNNESLGITSIDIDFNSSFAPLITIQFVDVRGSAIFQNDEAIKNNTNPYSVFFNLPYPLYKLTIKGYYGKPVQYCLHMTKFTSRFNANTGNFEITASFIGYTYAMLSDMLIGYLRAIANTDCGREKYRMLRETEDSTILTISELYKKIQNVNLGTKKLLAENPDYIEINALNKSLEQLDLIQDLINSFGINDLNSDLSQYDFYIIDAVKDISSQLTININSLNNNIDSYNQSINNTGLILLNKNSFNNISQPLYTTTINALKSSNNLIDVEIVKYAIKNNYDLNKKVKIYDNREKFKLLTYQKVNTTKELTNLRKSLGSTLKTELTKNLGFEPNIRTIVKTFTVAIEIFMSCIYDVSAKAETDIDRKDELKKVFNNLDVGKKNDYISEDNFYPWPDYREKEDGSGFVDKYLGEYGVLESPNRVNELVFIDNLLVAFLKDGQDDKDFNNQILEDSTNWFSINPLDSRYFNDLTPYKRYELITPDDVVLLASIRAAILFGFNKELSETEIQGFAEKEAELINLDVSPRIKSVLSATLNNNFNLSGVTGEINAINKNVFIKENDVYKYTYIDGQTDINSLLLPITSKIQGNYLSGDIENYAKDNKLFLTNYQSSIGEKPYLDTLGGQDINNDGGQYIKIITKEEYNNSNKINPLISDLPNTNLTLKLSELKNNKPNITNVGFNPFNGKYGIQEFTDLDYNDTNLIGLPFRFIFFSDSINNDIEDFNKTSGFALKRGIGLDFKKRTLPLLPYDLTNKTTEVLTSINSYSLTIDGLVDESTEGDVAQYNNSYRYHMGYGNNRKLINEFINNGNENISFPYINFQVNTNDFKPNTGLLSGVNAKDSAPISLFGSDFFQNQKLIESRAFLFLHTLPWNNLASPNGETTNIINTIFNSSSYEIQNIFNIRTGFISAPKLWVAFIGGLLWRYDYKENGIDKDPIIYSLSNLNSNISLIPHFSDSDIIDPDLIPSKREYLSHSSIGFISEFPCSSMSFSNKNTIGYNYKPIDNVILNMPEQARIEFKKAFQNFVTTDWVDINNKLNIFDNESNIDWRNTYTQIFNVNNALTLIPSQSILITDKVIIDTSILKSFYKNLNEYIVCSPIIDSKNGLPINDFKYNLFLELKDDSDAVKLIMDLITEETFISNSSIHIWKEVINNVNKINDETNTRIDITISEDTLTKYFKFLTDKINGYVELEKDSVKNLEQNIFNTNNEDSIKFMLYRTCKNIYDKWMGDINESGDIDGTDIIFQCGGRGSVDKATSKNKPRLIDSFRFVNRSFKDIGDDLAINPAPISDFIAHSPNSSFYDVVTSLLSANNFDFIALPNFINYNKPELLSSVFTPYSYFDSVSDENSGPSFVCVYLGQTSKNLDLGNGGNYPNDGFDVRCDNDGNILDLPTDFTNEQVNTEEPVTFFDVSFGHQNQNIFKDIILDQSEFSETAESLKIKDDISLNGMETKTTLAGQNIYNTYSVRSYKVEVEMLGDAMIQPMMYFQLNNIPMFHGAYMITRVRHALKPNHMSTNFTGVRIRKPETKIFNSADLYMSLVDTMVDLNPETTEVKKTSPAPYGDFKLGKTCGSFTSKIVDGVVEDSLIDLLNKTKPIRDIIATYESNGDYDVYNYRVSKDDYQIGKDYKIRTLTISKIKELQKNGNIFAVGKYQLIPETFITMVNDIGLNDEDLFNETLQEKAGIWLIINGAGHREGLRSFFANGSVGSEYDLRIAITDLALEFASMPTYYGTNTSQDISHSNPIGYNSSTSLYGGVANNAAEAKVCAIDVAKALIDTFNNLYPNRLSEVKYDNLLITTTQGQDKTPETNFDCDTNGFKPLTLNIASTSVILGDSTVAVLANVPNGLETYKIDIGYNCTGKDVNWLVNQLKQDKNIYKNILTLFLSIGTNDNYITTAGELKNIKELNSLITTKFPNAYKIVIPGTFGWGTVINKTKVNQDAFYAEFEKLGWNYNYPQDSLNNYLSAYFPTVTEAHNHNSVWFKTLVDDITYIARV